MNDDDYDPTPRRFTMVHNRYDVGIPRIGELLCYEMRKADAFAMARHQANELNETIRVVDLMSPKGKTRKWEFQPK